MQSWPQNRPDQILILLVGVSTVHVLVTTPVARLHETVRVESGHMRLVDRLIVHICTFSPVECHQWKQ